MRLVIYDCECFSHDWLVVFKDHESGAYTVVHNDADTLKACLSDENIYIGFNSKHYDQFIIKAICCGFAPEEVKAVNDYLIGGGLGWEYPPLREFFFQFNNADIRDDVQQGLSLKAIEGHLGMDIRESTVPFDLDRPLTAAELEETVFYCKHDVDATEKLVELRRDYLKTKCNLGRRAGIGEVRALGATNAKLTAMMLHAQRKEWHDGRDYTYPQNLDLTAIPRPVLDFFETIHDTAIPDAELFKTSLEIEIGGMPCKYAWGGVHGSLTAYHEEATPDRAIQNRDVSSLYPSLIEQYHYLSRNVPDPELFYAIRRDRIRAKHAGDKQTAADLKLPLNTVSGAQENPYNDLYDPLPTRSLRISGQLFLTVLTVRLLNACKSISLLNLNTDGLMYSVDRAELPIVDEVCAAWERETRFELEVDDIARVWIKDVNNLLLVKTDGAVKKVGGYLNYGVSQKGAWAVNNNAIVVKKAVEAYFVTGTPVEDTVNGDENILDFQLIAKAGSKYRESYQLVDGARVPVQKCNRVYATANARRGTLYKVKAEDGQVAKIENLPEHCVIDNDNTLTLADVDKQWYINVAKKRINDFLGVQPDKTTRRKPKMANTTAAAKKNEAANKMNVYQKLLEARARFLDTDVQKTGKNMHLSFKYFELDDIVPPVTRIFREVGLIALTSFTSDTATMTVINTDDTADKVVFEAPFNQIKPIVSAAGKQATNEMQALGSSITYMRRYLYMMAMDICESDGIDGTLGADTPAVPASKPPATPAQREDVKKSLTDPDGPATPLQVRQLKDALKKLKAAHPEKEEMVADIAVRTKGFTEITKTQCENILTGVAMLLEGKGEVSA